MPDTFGKRQRRDVQARKAAAREERRVARAQRRERRALGIPEPEEVEESPLVAPAEPDDAGAPADPGEAQEDSADRSGQPD